MVKTAPPEDAGDPVTVRPPPPLTEPMASSSELVPVADPPACETLPRPPRRRVASPPLLVLARPGVVPRAASAPPVTPPASRDREDFAGPNASRGIRVGPPIPECVLDRERLVAALQEADYRACRVPGEPPCGRLVMTLEPSGRFSRAEPFGAPSETGRCVARYLLERQVRFPTMLCSAALTFRWTYFVDR